MTALTIVFAGPSLPPALRPRDGGHDWRPPAAAGDLLRLLDDPPSALCLIDGYFDARPAVWHKEILMLLGAGVRVIGAASMGALRAAELDRHGMTGVGAIYRAYREGRLHGDDEVALVHAAEEAGWRPLSEPMVEVRATLLAAVRAGILAGDEARALRDAARAIHFSDRSWPLVLADAPAAVSARLRPWLATGTVRLKQQDAMLCLAAAAAPAALAAARPMPPLTAFLAQLAEETGIRLRP